MISEIEIPLCLKLLYLNVTILPIVSTLMVVCYVILYQIVNKDEYHFFLNCHLNQQPRNLLINTIENKCPSFTNMPPMHRLDYILNPTSELLSVVCTFIKQPLDLR